MINAKAPKIVSIVFYSVLFVLFALAGFNLFALRGVYFLLAAGLSLLHLFLIKRVAIRPALFFVAAFSLSLGIIFCRFTSFSLIQFLMIGILPLFAFLIGQNMADEKTVFGVVLAIALGYTLTVAISLVMSIQKGAIIDSLGLSFYFDVWLQSESPRTFVSIDLVPISAIGTAFFFLTTKRKWFVTISLGLAIVLGTLAVNGFVGNRSFLLISPILLIALLLYLGFKAGSTKKRIASWSTLTVLLLFAVVAYFGLKDNLFGIRDLAERIPAIARFADKTGSGRQQHYETFFANWLNYPRGGMFVENLFGSNEIHNTFLQVYSIGGWLPFLLEGLLLLFWLFSIFAIKITKNNRLGVITSISFSIAFFAICLFEPMITSEPFICSLFFSCAGYLYGEWARQRNRKPLLVIGLSHYSSELPSQREIIMKSIYSVVLIGGLTALTALSENGVFFSVFALALLSLGFALLDKAEYSVPSILKTILSFLVASSFAIALDIFLPTNSWMYALAKSGIIIALFIFLRITLVAKNEEKDGYYRLRNFFTKLAKDIDNSSEENLVGQDLQTNNKGE